VGLGSAKEKVTLRFLLDTHIVVQWLLAPRRLSGEQTRVLREAERRNELLALSAFSLIEIATLTYERRRVHARAGDIFALLGSNPSFHILPITIPIAEETAALSVLRDPADRTIVATARVHGLRLLTSDPRIISSKLVSFID
jgi:PIN domain nuclease of toxin-antitoxin system